MLTNQINKVDIFLKRHKLPKLIQEEIQKLYRPITSKEIELVIKNLPTKEYPDQMASLVNSIKHLMKN